MITSLCSHKLVKNPISTKVSRVRPRAIGAGGGLGVLLFKGFFAVHRLGIGFQLIRVATLAAALRNVQTPGCALRRILGHAGRRRIETMRVVAVVAGCIWFGFIVRVGLGVKRFFVQRNVVSHGAFVYCRTGRLS